MKLFANVRRRRCIDAVFSSIATLVLTTVMLVAAVITCGLWLLSGAITFVARRLGWLEYSHKRFRISILRA